ncbi:MAG: A24 family peptidase [bacterium]|nr:A24 family peptidase [Acidimicrobiia bacterium]MCY4649095.1 A24 family peptidase [bacterium]
MIEVGGALLAGAALGPAVNVWVTRQLARRGLGRSPAWRSAIRWMLPAVLGVGWAAMWSTMGWTAVLPAHLAWFTVTSALVVTDLEHKLIPNSILYPGTAVTATLLSVGAFVDPASGRMGTAVAGAVVSLVGMGLLEVAGKGALGMGDVKLSVLLGLVCGFRGVVVAVQAILYGFLIGGGMAVILLLTRRAHRRTQMPFAPALVVGAWLALFGSAV